MNSSIHPRLKTSLDLAEGLVFVARQLAKFAHRQAPHSSRPRRGLTLRPGPQTVFWNALVLAIRPHLRPYGAKSKLARFLGVPAPRVSAYFTARTQAPDAERTLLLLTWLAQRETAIKP